MAESVDVAETFDNPLHQQLDHLIHNSTLEPQQIEALMLWFVGVSLGNREGAVIDDNFLLPLRQGHRDSIECRYPYITREEMALTEAAYKTKLPVVMDYKRAIFEQHAREADEAKKI